jgi:PhnB protein
MQVQSYLFFDGRCDEALGFYKKTLGATVDMLMRFKEAPDQSMVSPDSREKVMHCAFHVGDTQVLASDGRCMGKPTFQGFGLALTVKNDAEAEQLFGALGDGGQVQMPMSETFFATRFGMVADKFGVGWMIIAPKPAGA